MGVRSLLVRCEFSYLKGSDAFLCQAQCPSPAGTLLVLTTASFSKLLSVPYLPISSYIKFYVQGIYV